MVKEGFLLQFPKREAPSVPSYVHEAKVWKKAVKSRHADCNTLVLKFWMPRRNLLQSWPCSLQHWSLIWCQNAWIFSVWDQWQVEATGTSSPPFHAWVMKHHAALDLKEKMLCPLREALGLGSPPSSYTTNANELMSTPQAAGGLQSKSATLALWEDEGSHTYTRQEYWLHLHNGHWNILLARRLLRYRIQCQGVGKVQQERTGAISGKIWSSSLWGCNTQGTYHQEKVKFTTDWAATITRRWRVATG